MNLYALAERLRDWHNPGLSEVHLLLDDSSPVEKFTNLQAI
jgi:hypothetical protein